MMIVNQVRKKELQEQIQKYNSEINQKLMRLKGLSMHILRYSELLKDSTRVELVGNDKELDFEYQRLNLVSNASWDSKDWENLTISTLGNEVNELRVGQILHNQFGSKGVIPARVPFIGSNKTFIIRSKDAKKGLELMQSLVVRTALMFPHQTRYTLLDPAGAGIAFPMRRYLPLVTENTSDIRRDLDTVNVNIQRIIESYLDASVRSFEEVPEEIRANERYSFVFAANFPQQYDRRAIEALQQIGNTGPASGTYTFIHWNEAYDLPRDISIDGFKNAITLDLDAITINSPLDMRIEYDIAPSPELQQNLFQKLRDAKAPERTIAWDDVVGISKEQWWTEDSSKIISTPVGVKSASERLDIWFGVNFENRPSAHGMMGAMTGSGKSNYCHVLITGLAIRYSPLELRMYLIDGKDGVEFQDYRNLPHAEVVSLRTSPELSRSVLEDLIKQKEWRNSIFAKAKVPDLKSYREIGQPFGNIPRILMVIDEYQELFEGDKDGIASNYLMQISQQGRSAGIHMLLISQRFGAAGMMNQNAIFGNMHLLIAMQMKSDDVASMTQFGRRGKALVASCDLPGKIVINDRGGDDSGNIAGKVAFLGSDGRKRLIEALQEKMQVLDEGKSVQRIVLDGKSQPVMIDNPFISGLCSRSTHLTLEELQQLARREIIEGGFGIIDWFAAERPSIAWVGQQFNVRGQATVILKRKIGSNALVIGSANSVRYATIASMLIGYVLNTHPRYSKFYIVDRSISDAAWSGVLRDVVETVIKPNGNDVRFAKDAKSIAEMLHEVHDIVLKRREMDEQDIIKEPNVYVFLTDLDSVELMCRKTDSYGGASYSPAGDMLKGIFSNGPMVGVHVILSFASVRAMGRVIDDRRIESFQHRIAFQMSEDESHALVRSRRASQLQIDGPSPVCALYVDVEADMVVKFKPYSIEHVDQDPTFFHNQLTHVAESLIGRPL